MIKQGAKFSFYNVNIVFFFFLITYVHCWLSLFFVRWVQFCSAKSLSPYGKLAYYDKMNKNTPRTFSNKIIQMISTFNNICSFFSNVVENVCFFTCSFVFLSLFLLCKFSSFLLSMLNIFFNRKNKVTIIL